MWNDLDPAQRDWWFRKAAAEAAGESSSSSSTMGGSMDRYPSSPTILSSSASGPCTPSSASASALGAHYSPLNPTRSFLLPAKAVKLESRSPPTTFIDEDSRAYTMASYFHHSRSGSPSLGEDASSASGSHIPRPPNAWILYR
jgi:hypothetical protein